MLRSQNGLQEKSHGSNSGENFPYKYFFHFSYFTILDRKKEILFS